MAKTLTLTKKNVLKPCPFCGGEAVLSDEVDIESQDVFHMFTCNKCGAGVVFSEIFEDGTAGDIEKGDAIKAWNRRVEFEHMSKREALLKESEVEK